MLTEKKQRVVAASAVAISLAAFAHAVVPFPPPEAPASCQTRQIKASPHMNRTFSSPTFASSSLAAKHDSARIAANLRVQPGARVLWSVTWDQGKTWVDVASLPKNKLSADEGVEDRGSRGFSAALPAGAQSALIYVRANVLSKDGAKDELCRYVNRTSTEDDAVIAAFNVAPTTLNKTREN